jgi:23S rRNA (cytidine1920-2'-O)/16S rRNA (cytidine1409-2'-O)-methyltransferase
VIVTPEPLQGERKLAAALESLRTPIEVSGCVALDVGASTGGFTRELLTRGARRVFSVDVGFGQLLGSLRQDPRVVNLEATNAAELTPELITEPPNIVTVDVSYTPLAVVVPQVSSQVPIADGARLLALVKPMFELQLGGLPTTDDEFAHAVGAATEGISRAGWTVLEAFRSSVLGHRGAVEFWISAARST